jgi:hypothetical protein
MGRRADGYVSWSRHGTKEVRPLPSRRNSSKPPRGCLLVDTGHRQRTQYESGSWISPGRRKRTIKDSGRATVFG